MNNDNNQIVATAQTKYGPKAIYDSGIIVSSYHGNISVNLRDFAKELLIPSSRFYYFSKQGYRVPYLSYLSGDDEQLLRDLNVWLADGSTAQTVYRTHYVGRTDKLSENKLLNLTLKGYYFDRELAPFQNYESEDERKFLTRFPVNMTANRDLIKSMLLGTNEEFITNSIQTYLDDREIFTIDSNVMKGKGRNSHLEFILTRFYGYPITSNFMNNIYLTYYRFFKMLPSIIYYDTRYLHRIADEIKYAASGDNPEKTREYLQYQSPINEYFNQMINTTRRNWNQTFNVSIQSFYQDPYSAIILSLKRSSIPLTKEDGLRAYHQGSLHRYLSQYNDQELINFLASINEYNRNYYKDKIRSEIIMGIVNLFEVKITLNDGNHRCDQNFPPINRVQELNVDEDENENQELDENENSDEEFYYGFYREEKRREREIRRQMGEERERRRQMREERRRQVREERQTGEEIRNEEEEEERRYYYRYGDSSEEEDEEPLPISNFMIGSDIEGYRCYDIEALVNLFENNGYQIVDPLVPDRMFTKEEFEKILQIYQDLMAQRYRRINRSLLGQIIERLQYYINIIDQRRSSRIKSATKLAR